MCVCKVKKEALADSLSNTYAAQSFELQVAQERLLVLQSDNERLRRERDDAMRAKDNLSIYMNDMQAQMKVGVMQFCFCFCFLE